VAAALHVTNPCLSFVLLLCSGRLCSAFLWLLLQLLDEYFGRDNELDAAGAFLKSYLANKAWKESTDGPGGGSRRKKRLRGLDGSSSSSEDEGDSSGDEEGGSSGSEDGGVGGDINVDEDEEFLEEVDRFEAAYNFR
jgi:hypothetical protein